MFGLPLVHVVRGIDPSSGRRPTAVGIIAVGQVAVGVIAIGQVAVGAISLGQASIGLGWGIGQLAFGMLAAGQVAAGLLGAAGQLAVAPARARHGHRHGLFVAVGLAADGACAGDGRGRRRRRLGPLLDTPSPTRIASVRDGRAHVAAEVVSDDQLRAPLSSRPCVFWHTVHVGPAMREHERSGGNVMIGDESGQACVDFGSEVIFIRSDSYREIAGPDWALHLETSLARGETLHVAGPVTVTSDPSAGAPYPRRRVARVLGAARRAAHRHDAQPARDPDRAAVRRRVRLDAGRERHRSPRSPGRWSFSRSLELRGAEAQLPLDALGFTSRVHADAVASRPLGLVHRRVGGRDERLRVVDLALDGGADADRDRDDLARVLEAVLLDGRAQPLAQRARAVGLDLAADDGELLAAVARQHVLGADRRGHHARDAPPAPGRRARWPYVVVDLLEVVDVDEQQRQRLARAGPRSGSPSAADRRSSGG